jgi:hypothetical protein
LYQPPDPFGDVGEIAKAVDGPQEDPLPVTRDDTVVLPPSDVPDSVTVRSFAYVPLCRASTALMSWLYSRDTASLETGPFHARRFSGDADPNG